MKRLLKRAHRNEDGFSLIEVLVVILVIGILAAIVLGVMLGQRDKGQDASAKSQVRALVPAMESCLFARGTYLGCDTSTEVTLSGIPRGNGLGQATISGLSDTGYTLTGNSRGSRGGAHRFVYRRAADVVTRTCTPIKQGGCNALGRW